MRFLPSLAGLLAVASLPVSAGLLSSGVAGFVTPVPCATGSLASYIALGGIGCSLDVYGTEFTAKGFSFEVTAAGGGIVPLDAGQITISPSAVGGIGLAFTGSFKAIGTEFVTYLIGYTIDPPPAVIPSFEMELLTETPVFPGTARVDTNLCIGRAFFGALCNGPTASVNVFHFGTTFDKFDRADFPATNVVGVRTFISLAGNGSTSDIRGMASRTLVLPEPGTAVLLAAGLVGLSCKARQIRG